MLNEKLKDCMIIGTALLGMLNVLAAPYSYQRADNYKTIDDAKASLVKVIPENPEYNPWIHVLATAMKPGTELGYLIANIVKDIPYK